MRLEPLTPEGFAPFGEVLQLPDAPGRHFFNGALRTDRPGAGPSLSLSYKEPSATPLTVRQMERHRFSSQSFVPLDPARFVVLVAPHAVAGGPDMARARAFLAEPGQGVTYGADVWHHPFTVVGGAARFAVFMWLDGTTDDEEFVDVTPFTLELP
ncbi:ureidoglycolate lyase [Pararoseomonas indoligenes]|uniref:Ureidoglycolate lyase n=1 Tax=Roseomonas indoligenes TaxID=2820811 RepID=A0A940MT26_9PROT|nr:ureidoglycolate lyase [Pararoseomonas indoligenes]MBP0491391.1 ureidoglycolate lyase [Pararoseomonas indoligenes]